MKRFLVIVSVCVLSLSSYAQLNGIREVPYFAYSDSTMYYDSLIIFKSKCIAKFDSEIGYERKLEFVTLNRGDYYFIRDSDTLLAYKNQNEIEISDSILDLGGAIHSEESGKLFEIKVRDHIHQLKLEYGLPTGVDTLSLCGNFGIDDLELLYNYVHSSGLNPVVGKVVEDDNLRYQLNSTIISDLEALQGVEFISGDTFRLYRIRDIELIGVGEDSVCEPKQLEDTIILAPLILDVIGNCPGKVSGHVIEKGTTNRLSDILVGSNTGEITVSDSLGRFSFNFTERNEIITQVFIADINYLSDTVEIYHSIDSKVSSGWRALGTFLYRENDLSIKISNGHNRPGFTIPYYVAIENRGKNDLASTMYVDLDPNLSYSYQGTDDTPPSVANQNELMWYNITVKSGETKRIKFYATLDRLTPLGTELYSRAWLDLADDVISNNADTLKSVVTGSYDPNDKLVEYEGLHLNDYVHDTTSMEYTIRFQNTGTDTAFTVKVEDVISEFLDLTSFQMVDASHDYSLDIYGKDVVWTFSNILLPDSNINEPASHGFIRFSIDQKEDNLSGTNIKNEAAIYFDFNEPIITNEVISIVDNDVVTGFVSLTVSDDGLIIYPSPAQETIHIQQNGELLILDQLGKVLKTTTNKSEVDISDLGSGVYYIQLNTGQGVLTGSFIKQ